MLALIVSSLLAAASFASADAQSSDITGRMTLRIRSSASGGRLFVEARQEGDRIVGRSNFSSDPFINLRVQPGVSYQGSAGGGYTDLSCSDSKCQGVIGDKSAQFSFDAFMQRGSLNFNRLRISRAAHGIVIDSLGALDLAEVGPGLYEGRGFLNSNPSSGVWAELETSGTLLGLTDPALLTILVASVVAGR